MIAHDRTRSHKISQDRTDLSLHALLHGLLLAKWSCRIAPGTLIGDRAILFSAYDLMSASIESHSVFGIQAIGICHSLIS